MLAEMQQQAAARDLAIKRQARLKAVVEVDREAEKAQIEFVRLGDIEDAKDRDDLIEADFHDSSTGL